jgi:hypothetical protein
MFRDHYDFVDVSQMSNLSEARQLRCRASEKLQKIILEAFTAVFDRKC